MTQQPHPPWKPIETAPDNTMVLVAWVGIDAIESGWIETNFWHGRLPHGTPDFWREPENAKLLKACKAAYRYVSGDCTDGELPMPQEGLIILLRTTIDAEETDA